MNLKKRLKDIDARKITKGVVGLVVQIGAGIVIKEIIGSHVDLGGRAKRIAVGTASLGIGGAITTAAIEYTDGWIDAIFDAIDNARKDMAANRY